MSTNSVAAPQLAPLMKVYPSTFIGIMWGGFGAGTLLVLFRLAVRLKAFRKLDVDDACVVLAWAMALATSITWQRVHTSMYLNNAVASGHLYPPPANFVSESELYLSASAGLIAVFYSSLWMIKLSFLFFFRRLYRNVQRLKYHWIAVLVVVITTWVVCIGTIQYNCLVKPLEEIAANCSSTDSVRYQRTTLQVNCAMDLISDACIMSIPMSVLWKVRISVRRKLALGSIFSLTVVTMIIAIIRVTVTSSVTVQPDTSWLYLLSNVEISVALIIACGASFRTMFTTKNSQRDRTPTARKASTEVKKPWLVLNLTSPRLFLNLTHLISHVAELETQNDTFDDLPYSDDFSLEKLGSSATDTKQDPSTESGELGTRTRVTPFEHL